MTGMQDVPEHSPPVARRWASQIVWLFLETRCVVDPQESCGEWDCSILRAASVCGRWHSLLTGASLLWSDFELCSGSTMFGGGQWQRQMPVLAFLRRQCQQIVTLELKFKNDLEVRMLRNEQTLEWTPVRLNCKAQLSSLDFTSQPIAH